jgi:TatD DNase family protein
MIPQAPVRLFDSHAHLDIGSAGPREIEAMLDRAWRAGLEGIVVVAGATRVGEYAPTLALAAAEPRLWVAAGIHPHAASGATPDALGRLRRILDEPRLVALGETGLDYHYNHSPAAEQQETMRRFCAIARRAKKPLSLHIRDAHADAARILTEEGAAEVGGVIHCFTGDLRDAQAYVALGFHISLSGVVTFKSAEPIREAAAWVPMERLLVETDCPFLAPVPLRGKRNEPAYITHTAAVVAALRGLLPDQFAEATTRNCRALFRLH